MELSGYLESILADTDAVADVAATQPQRAVVACPGWDVGDLTRHLGSTHRWVSEIVSADSIGRVPFPDAPEVPDDQLGAWLRQGASELVAALSAAGPDKSVWTMGEPRTSWFWFRRQAIETSLHRWDAEAGGMSSGGTTPRAIDSALATEGLSELLETLVPRLHRRGGTSGSGETFHVHRTDGAGEWFVRFDASGAVVTKEHAKGDVALRGSAADLLLVLWRRQPLASVDVFGDDRVLARWEQLVPAM